MRANLRILLWTEHFLPLIGGIETHQVMYLREMAARGHQFMVITSRVSDALVPYELLDDIPLYRFDLTGPVTQGDLIRWVKQQRQLTQLIDAFDPDLVHVFGLGASALALLQILKRSPRPLLVRIASTYLDPGRELNKESIPYQVIRQADWVTTVAEAVKTQIVQYIPEVAPHISVLYNGHPPAPLPPAPYPTPPHVLFVGRLHPKKGVEDAITAFAQAHAHRPELRLTIAGDGELRGQWEAQAAPLGQAVHFTGWIPPGQVHALINTATLLILPSKWEGLPNIAIEAGAMARPLVANDVAGVREVVQHGKTGLLVPAGDTAAMAQGILRLVENPAEVQAMGEAARAWVQQQFTIERCVDDYEALLPRVIARRHMGQTGAVAHQN